MNKCYIGIGSNLASPKKQVLLAIETLDLAEDIVITKKSSLYETKPVDYLEQPDFINAVIEIETDIFPSSLLAKLQRVECNQGRVRDKARRYGPRIIDIDILLYSDRILCTEELVIPASKMLERAFVLYPLAEICPHHYIFSQFDWAAFQRVHPKPRIILSCSL